MNLSFHLEYLMLISKKIKIAKFNINPKKGGGGGQNLPPQAHLSYL
jgi:hypothetical protein